MTPAPVGAMAMTCGTQVMEGEEVQANQKRPRGRRRPPMNIGTRRSSGGMLPVRAWMGARRYLVMRMIIRAPMQTPARREMKGRLDMPGDLL